jgi:hypothetical protein
LQSFCSLTVTVTASYAGQPFYEQDVLLTAAAPRQPITFPANMQGPVSSGLMIDALHECR